MSLSSIRPRGHAAFATGRARRLPARALVTSVFTALVLVMVATPAGATTPAQPTSGPGANGPCTITKTSEPNPSANGETLNVYTPGGTAAAPTGGNCNDAQRPTAIVVHGLSAGSPTLYADIIRHLASTGNVVIFATYETDSNDFVGSFTAEDQAIVAAAAMTTRDDNSRVGIIGHSMGGGAIPFLVQRIATRGWGTNGLWAMALAPWTIAGVDAGTIQFPANTHVAVEAYDQDTLVDRGVGIDMFNRISVPLSQKQHVTVQSSSKGFHQLSATHVTPNSWLSPEDALKFFGIYRVADALQGCSQRNELCNTDFSYMGTWSDGTPVKPAISTDTPS